jgi:hypothetical protein
VNKPQAKRAQRVTRPKSTVTQGEAYGEPPYDQGEEGREGISLKPREPGV